MPTPRKMPTTISYETVSVASPVGGGGANSIANEFVEHARKGNLAQIKRMLEFNPHLDVNRKASYDKTALMAACDYGRVDVAIHLADHPKINLNVRNKDGQTALYYCLNSVEILKHLLAKPQLHICVRDAKGWTPLHYACSKNHAFGGGTNQAQVAEGMELLLDHRDTNPQARTKVYGSTPLDVARKRTDNEGGPILRQCLLLHTTTATQHEPSQQFLEAAKAGQLEELQYLILQNAVVDFKVSYLNGLTALHLASRYGHLSVLQFLVEHTYLRTQLALRDYKGRTPLHEASRWSTNAHIVDFWLQHMTTSDTLLVDEDGCTAQQIAVASDNTAVAEVFDRVFQQALLHQHQPGIQQNQSFLSTPDHVEPRQDTTIAMPTPIPQVEDDNDNNHHDKGGRLRPCHDESLMVPPLMPPSNTSAGPNSSNVANATENDALTFVSASNGQAVNREEFENLKQENSALRTRIDALERRARLQDQNLDDNESLSRAKIANLENMVGILQKQLQQLQIHSDL